MRHKKSTIHKYKNRKRPKNKYNKTRKNPLRNRSKQVSRKYKILHRKTIKLRGGSDLLSKAYGAVQKGLSSVGSVFGDPDATQDLPPSDNAIMAASKSKTSHVPMPNNFTNVEYAEMIKFQQKFIDSIRGIRSSKTKSPNYTIITTLLNDIVAFKSRLASSDKHYDFLIGYFPSTPETYGLQIIDFSRGYNQLPMVIKLYIESAQFNTDYATEELNDDAKGIHTDFFTMASYIENIANNKTYNYNRTLIGMLDAIYYCIPDKTICLELTRRLHSIDPHIVERVSPLTWTTPLCTAVYVLEDKKIIVELMDLIKSNQNTQKALFHYSEDSYYPTTIDNDQFREYSIKIIGDMVESAKMFILMQKMIGTGSMANPDGSVDQVISVTGDTHYIYATLGHFWEKYKGYLIKYCSGWYEPQLPLAVSQWLGISLSDYIAEIKQQKRMQTMSEAELLAQFEDTPKADKGSKKTQPKQQQQQKKKLDKEVEDRKKAEADEKERVRLEQAMKREEAEQKKAAKAAEDAERKRVADEAEAERKRVADEEKKLAKAAKKAQKKAEEALAATAAAEAEAERAREKQILSRRTPPFVEPEPEEYSEKYTRMEEGSQGAAAASQSIEMEDTTQFRSIAEPLALLAPIPAGPKVAYPDLQGLRLLGVNPDSIIASTMSLLQPYIDSGNINGVCGLITSKITNYTLQNDMYYNFMSCVIFIILGQLTNLLKTTRYRLILKGSKALQVVFANTIDTKPYLISDDIDILLVPADREAVQTKPGMYTDSGIVAGDICSMIEFIIKSALPPGLSELISVLNPMKQYARNPNVFKISHFEPNERRFSVIADIDIRYTKNAAMIFSQEDDVLSRMNFPIMSEDRSFDVFYNPSRMFDTTIDIPNMQLVYLHQTIDAALEEKIYYYTKYLLLSSYTDYSFFLDKFKKSILAILKYNYFMIPAKDRKKFIDYSKLYITNFLSRTPLKQFSDIVFRALFA